MSQQVIVLIPARNEASFITFTLQSLFAQTRPPDKIIVAADNCTDNTAELAKRYGAEVFETEGNVHLKAGAINQALCKYLPTLQPNDAVLVMDADSELSPRWMQEALIELAKPNIGSVGVLYVGRQAAGRSLLKQLQRNEYRRCVRSGRRSRGGGVTWCLSGVGSLFRVEVLRAVLDARASGRLPSREHGAVGIYSEGDLTEDFEITLALKHLGFRCVTLGRQLAFSDLMPTWGKFWKQRIRWLRGAIEDLNRYGLNRITLPYTIRLAWYYLGAFTTVLWFVLMVLALSSGEATWPLLWKAVTAVFIFERAWSVRQEGVRGVSLAILMLPEIVYDTVLQGVHIYTAWLFLRRAPRRWEAT